MAATEDPFAVELTPKEPAQLREQISELDRRLSALREDLDQNERSEANLLGAINVALAERKTLEAGLRKDNTPPQDKQRQVVMQAPGRAASQPTPLRSK